MGGGSLKLLARLRQHESLLVWGMFALALVVRLRDLLLIEHNVDHAYYIGQALRTLYEGYLPIIGQATSLQFPNSAFLGYLYLPWMALTHHVLSAYVFVIALNSLGAVFMYRSARWVGLPVVGALAAAVLYTFNPWLIEYTRSTWSYSIMPFLLTLLFYSVCLMISTQGRRQHVAVVVGAVATALITLVTLTGYLILPTLFVSGLVLWRDLPWRKIVLASPVVILPSFVFVGAVLADWHDMSGRASAFLAASEAAHLRSEPILHALRLVSGADYELQRGQEAPTQDVEQRTILTGIFHAVFILLVGVGLIRLPHRTPYARLIVIWALVPVALMSYNSALIHPFYLMLTIPSMSLIAASGIAALGKHRNASWIVIGLLVAWAMLSVTNSARYYQETAATPGRHGLTALPLGEWLRLGSALTSLRTSEWVLADVEAWILHSPAGTTFPSLQYLDNQRRIVVPPQGVLHVRSGELTEPLRSEEVLWQQRLVDGTVLTIARLSASLPDTATAVPHIIEGNVALVGYDLRVLGGRVALDVYWRVHEMPQDVSPLYSLAVHVFRDGERVAMADGLPVETYLWERGALIGQRAVLPILEDDRYEVRVGLYDGSRGLRPFVGGQGEDGMVLIPEQLVLPLQNGE